MSISKIKKGNTETAYNKISEIIVLNLATKKHCMIAMCKDLLDLERSNGITRYLIMGVTHNYTRRQQDKADE